MTNSGETCVVHYGHLCIENQDLTPLSNDTYARLIDARDCRIRLGGAHYHKLQIKSIPETFTLGEHYVHSQCYKNFTKAISVLSQRRKAMKKIDPQRSPLKRKKRSHDLSGNLFPSVCMKCKTSKPIKVKGKKQQIKVVQTFSSCRTLQQAATLRNDQEMLAAISGVDLIAKEFKMHQKCYKEYTLICSKRSATASAAAVCRDTVECEGSASQQRTTTDFEAVCSFVTSHVIGGCQTVSLTVLTDMYGFDSNDARLHAKVKQRLRNTFGDKLIFLTISYHEPQLVISRSALSSSTINSFIMHSKQFILKEAAVVLRKEIVGMISNAPELPWPPTAESLTWNDRKPPESVKEFLKDIIHATHHSPGDDVQQYVDSFAQDLGKWIPAASFLN